MVTDISTNYTSPAGKDYTIAAGRFAGINPAARVLDMGCGYGESSCNIASEFRARVTSVDISEENIEFAREYAVRKAVSHLITFHIGDIMETNLGGEPFDLILAEGGIFSFIGRRRGLALSRSRLAPRGWLAFSDLIFIADKAPGEVLTIFEDDRFHYETEGSYRQLIKEAGFSLEFTCLVPPSGWDNYYAHMARRLEDQKGFFADRKIKLAFHKEIDVFYRLGGSRYVGYLVCFARAFD
ncbi:MAG: methyltransferase domain-containing protein [Chitinivibrionales bacterium]|nr:methyltransferase domain-containing protein [Chitinivibrionales bacterium]MBD3356099.1 methyltransferase domain-containing protein [Chitinivibrionales bacterium]